ncbi:MAG: hypothetical protein D4S01_08570 [Dehalococcoidia bacterium]|nr:MAG: hypothetical protein D4S01_08570 [Dehalococcoidia bacterium]
MIALKDKTVHFIAGLVFLVLAIITLRGFLFSSELFQYRDVTWPSDISKLVSDVSYTLNLDYLRRIIYLGPIFGSINLLGLTALTAEKFVFLLTRFMMGFSPYLALYGFLSLKTENIRKKSIFTVSVFAGFFYAYNPIAASMISTNHAFAFSYSLIPLIFYYFDRTLNEKNFSNIFITSLLTSLAIAGVMHFLVLLPVFIFLPWLITVVFQKRHDSKQICLALKNFGFLILLSFLTSFYWILPSFSSMLHGVVLQPGYVLTNDMLNIFSSKTTLLNIFRLLGDWWPHVSLSPIIDQSLWLALTFTIPVALALSILFSKKLKFYIIALSLITLLVIFLHKGSQPPISGFYSLLYDVPVVGWMFRVPDRIGLILPFFMTIIISIGIYNLLLLKVTRFTRYLKCGLILFLVLSTSLISWPMFTGNFGGIVSQNSYPLTNDLTNLKSDAYKVYLYPYDPYIAVDLPVAYYRYNQYINFITSNIGENTTIGELLSPLNVKYLIFSKPFPENTTLHDLIPINETSSYLIFKNPNYTGLIDASTTNILVFGGLEGLSALNSLDAFNFTTTSLLFPDQNVKILNSDVLNTVENVIINDKTSFILPFIYKDSTIVAPFGATNRHKPSEVWSVAMTSDPMHADWHSYLKEFGISNWDFDYGKGLVFTWAASKLIEKPTPTGIDLIDQWTFESINDLALWKKYTRETQFGAFHPLTLDNNALRAELWNSTWGWKTIKSPLIPAEYGNWYRWELETKGENAHSVHVKIVEYDQDQKIMSTRQVKSVGSGSFDWNSITLDCTPETPETKYIQLQIWHGHETTQPLPNKIWIRNVKTYDLQRFTEPVTLEIPFSLSETGEYVFLTRLFQNQQGGTIQIKLDDKNYAINTKDQLNKFTWKQIDTLTLQKGQHKIILTNLEGFNAINLFTLIPKQNYQDAQNQLAETLQNKRAIYILEAETDLYYENAATSNKYGGEASNGIILELNPTSKIYNEIDIQKPGNYTIAIRSKGNLNITIDEKTYQTNSTILDWAYICPITLETGKHKIEIRYPPTYYAQWNFENGEPLEWTGNHPKVQTLTLDENSYEGRYSLKAELNASTGGWKTIQSPLIPVTPETKYSWDFYVAGENAHAVHFKIAEYDINKALLSGTRMPGGGSGNFTWTQINFDYTPSENATYIALQIWHGHETTQPMPNKIWIDNVKVQGYSKDPSELDVIWLYSTQNPNETIEDIFTTNEIPAEIISYQKIDPTKYVVKVNAKAPFMLSFAEAYDPLWIAQVNGQKINSIPLYSVTNGFWINQTGTLEITIEYEPQKWFYYGLAVSLLTLTGCVLYLAKRPLHGLVSKIRKLKLASIKLRKRITR